MAEAFNDEAMDQSELKGPVDGPQIPILATIENPRLKTVDGFRPNRTTRDPKSKFLLRVKQTVQNTN